jgi:hypothetical protein
VCQVERPGFGAHALEIDDHDLRAGDRGRRGQRGGAADQSGADDDDAGLAHAQNLTS